MSMPFKAAQACATAALRHYLPQREDMDWLAEVVDRPRFGWDWPALEQGFFEPMRAWAARHDARLKPVLAGLLIDALGGDKRRHPALLAALEFSHLASCMLDDVHNGRDLAESQGEQLTMPLPVWVTVAYNARQLAPVLVMRRSPELAPADRLRLARHYLFQQHLGCLFDIWGVEQGLAHGSLLHYLTHLSNYCGAPGFGLAAATAAVAAGLDDGGVAELRQAGIALGVSLRLRALAEGEDRAILFAGRRSVEPGIHWRFACDRQVLADSAKRLDDAARYGAERLSPAAGAALSDFLDALAAPIAGDKLS
ncbi:hypothetical protein [Paludibacterium sp.]|uniref:hypothetical protein n=1 Tax=Paludibacterium sp. TaxID=1917523 RepID=UPI0025F874CA|nr:hypothetical protein [Paludibacterium sp.]MBV8649421.1 hypothetical protein [Paludibacterium sp.]